MKTIKALPRIGIRPVIDGRRMGVRESLEEQTMNMAKATAALLSEKLRHPCGTPVECVIADSCIAGMAESAACEEKFSTCHVGLTITITPAGVTGVKPLIWIRCARKRSGALMAPSVRGGILAAALAAHNQKGSRRFPFTATMYRMRATRPSRQTLRKNCCASPGRARRSPA